MAFHEASSSSSSSPRWSYDVFVSFRGGDTRKTFTAHLYEALRQNGINTFMDDKLRSGEEISLTLLKVIEASAISLIVLSKNYASSRWCLDELIKILDCRKTMGHQILPLFYDVNPTEIRYQTNSVGEAFAPLKERFKDDQTKVNQWKAALRDVANLSGRPLGNRNEPEFIREIIEWVNSILVKKTNFQVAQYPIQIESRVRDVKSLLNLEKNENTCMVGIFGTGGIGKTTIAKAVYNSIASLFECSCFLENIRETSDQRDGLLHLQSKLIYKILGGSSLMVDSVDQGVTLIKQRLCNLRVLLILDDVDQPIQLEKLAGKGDWFGLGSKIILTTRDKDLLRIHGVDVAYEVTKLNPNEALQLFSWHAFKRNEPNEDFVELTRHVIKYAGGLPLALVVLGSYLFGKGLHEWKSELDRYKRIPNKTIQKILQISYDGLEDTVKDIFLDIACFFKGKKLVDVSKILDECGLFPEYGIKVLVNKSLISIDDHKHDKNWLGTIDQSYKSLEMHDLLQEMGREIVRQQSPKEPGMRSRLWFHEDVRHVLEGETGTEDVEGILIDLPKPDRIDLSPKAFKKMKRLRLFINCNARFSGEPSFLSNGLRLLDWPHYPGKSLPTNFRGRNLVVLKMLYGQLKELGGVQNFQNMTIMDFTGCKFLRRIPHVSSIRNLETLILDFCEDLVEVHHSVGFLDKLVLLSVKACGNLKSFPRSLKLRSLKSLFVGGSPMLVNFPEIECQMKCLEHIEFKDTGIKDLPSSIEYLVAVKRLVLSFSPNLTNLPDSICQLQHLEELSLTRCTSIKQLPSSFGYLGRIKTLDLEECRNLMNLPDSIYQLQQLEILNLTECEQLRGILRLPPNVVEVKAGWCKSLAIFLEEPRRSQLLNTCDPPKPVSVSVASPALQSFSLGNNVVTKSEFLIQLDCPSRLKVLNLQQSAIVSLPTWLNRFVGLEELYLNDCKQLEEISELPPNIRKVYATGCTSLERFQSNNIKDLPMLEWIDFSNCHGLRENMGDHLQIRLMSEGLPMSHEFGCIFSGNKILDCFRHCKEVSNTTSCEIDINEFLYLDSMNTRFSFSAVIGTKNVPDQHSFRILVEVINNGQHIYFHRSDYMHISASSHHVWLNYHGSHHSQLKTDNLRVKFTCELLGNHNPPKSVFFKSCGFHLEHRYEGKAIGLIDGVQVSKRRRDDDDDDDDDDMESNQKRHSSSL